jgi:RimJ/RimL family protein N-acetyltransferase
MLGSDFRITTPRLHLCHLDPCNDSHMSFRVRLADSRKVLAMAAQSIAPPQPQTIEAARAALQAADQRLDKAGTGRYIVSLRNPDLAFGDKGEETEYIGIVSMQLKRYPHMQCPLIPDLGFVFHADYHGKGFATEACEAVIHHFNKTRGFERFAGFTHPENMNSQKLFTRLGFHDRGLMPVAGVVGEDGSAASLAVWVKGVDPDTELSKLGIGLGT